MKRFLAVLALVLVLVAGTAGMASADTIGFDSYPPSVIIPPDPPSLPYPPEISGTTSMNWDGTGSTLGHLWCANPIYDSTISFTDSTYVNKFEMTGLPWSGAAPVGSSFAMDIAAFRGDVQVWSRTVDFLIYPPGENSEYYSTAYNWLTVEVNTPNISSIIFKAPDPGGLNGDLWFYPSIDNLVINEGAAVPIPASVWLLASGLLALVGLRRKFSR